MYYLENVRIRLQNNITITTLINCVFTAVAMIVIVFGIVAVGGAEYFLLSLSERGSSSSNDIIDGYKALGTIGAVLAGSFGWVLSAAIVMIGLGFFIPFIFTTLHGFLSLQSMKSSFYNNIVRYRKTVKRDSIIKIVVNIPYGILVFVSFMDVGFPELLFSVPFFAVVGVSIANLVMIKK